MKIYTGLPSRLESPVALTIGNFDGVHLGHQKVLSALCQKASALHLSACAITFSNHPATVLQGTTPLRICSNDYKNTLLGTTGIDILYSIPFTKSISEMSPQDFFESVYRTLPFHALILGSDATLGKGRSGTPEVMQQLAHSFHFYLEYLKDEMMYGDRISSRRIRGLLEKGDLSGAAELLGRPYCIEGKVIPGIGKGSQIGFHTANIDVAGLCLPPLGVYAVIANVQGKRHLGVANLGNAPTVHINRGPQLEVHLLDHKEDLYGCSLIVEFREYLRSEKRFENIEVLKTQISNDVERAREALGQEGGTPS